MKKKYIYLVLLVFLVFLCKLSIAQVFEGSVIFGSQSDVEEFGANNYKSIIGNVTINSGSTNNPITNLSPLNTIEEIKQADEFDGITINDLSSVEDLDVFPNLILLEGSLVFNGDDISYTKISGFQSLKTIGGELIIRDLKGVEDISGFQSIKEIQANLTIAEMPDLKTTGGFSSLERIEGSLNIYDNPVLEDLAKFDSLETVSYLRIANNNSITSIDGFNALRTVNEDIAISEHAALIEINGFNALDSLFGSLLIIENPAIERVEGFTGWEYQAIGNLSDVERSSGITISENPSLSSFNGFKNLKKVTNFNLLGMNKVNNLQGLCSIEEVTGIGGEDGFVFITGSEFLTNCYALCGLIPFEDYIISGGAGDCVDGFSLNTACTESPELNTCAATTSVKNLGEYIGTVFPNPTNLSWTINDGYSDATYSLYDMTGQLRYTANGNTQDITILGEHLIAGMYILKVSSKTNEYLATKLLVKN